MESSLDSLTYLNQNLEGFSGIIKLRCEDFLVHEIDKTGKILSLDSFELPLSSAERIAQQQKELAEKPFIVEESMTSFQQSCQLDKVSYDNLNEWVTSLFTNPGSETKSEITLEPIEDKTKRTSVHQAVRNFLPFFGTDSVQGGVIRVFLSGKGKHFISKQTKTEITPQKRTSPSRDEGSDEEPKPSETAASFSRRKRPRSSKLRKAWKENKMNDPNRDSYRDTRGIPREEGEYVHCVLYKQNMDTLSAVDMIRRVLRCNSKCFNFAGTKDRVACTSQKLCLSHLNRKQIMSINNISPFLKVGNFSYSKDLIKLGDLSGNHFTLVIRDIPLSATHIGTNLQLIQQNGFVNYFGSQRFGTGQIRTHEIGRMMLKKNFEGAVKLIMGFHQSDSPEIRAAKTAFIENGAIHPLKDVLSRNDRIGHAILNGLEAFGEKNYSNALSALPRNRRSLYMHAYQSYLFNIAVSFRLTINNTNVIVGDLVMPHSPIPAETRERHVGLHVVSEEDVNENRFSLNDVVIPIVGASSILPQNEVGEMLTKVMTEEGTLDALQGQGDKDALYNLDGDYRHIIHVPGNMTWEIVPYSSDEQVFTQTDLNKMDPSPTEEKNGAATQQSPPTKLACILNFSLKTSGYATMLLREAMRNELEQPTDKMEQSEESLNEDKSENES
ncbi:putative Pseudouridylate synthase 7 like protein [Blattamonas nauphoetae]|uniref:Pseudouridylate synthase 7 like protein n=1 Tax=Blattamonas nauphoetae TaxID=2049346 RepID=A0ABQ9YEU0_9EUKA|nr:putative Pseudouridylate synthase 7 like protein [Blattamonas nauphoetae]